MRDPLSGETDGKEKTDRMDAPLCAGHVFIGPGVELFAPDRARLYRRGVRAADGGRTLCGAGLCRGRRCGLLRRARGVHPGPGGREVSTTSQDLKSDKFPRTNLIVFLILR